MGENSERASETREDEIAILQDDVNRLNAEVDDLKEKYEKIVTALLAIEKEDLSNETKLGIQALRNDVANSASRIVNA